MKKAMLQKCRTCKGKGSVPLHFTTEGHIDGQSDTGFTCPTCMGSKKVDWVTNAICEKNPKMTLGT